MTHEHEWLESREELYRLVGGIESNPGVRGLGGARMSIQSVCVLCGTLRTEYVDPSGQTEEREDLDVGRYADWALSRWARAAVRAHMDATEGEDGSNDCADDPILGNRSDWSGRDGCAVTSREWAALVAAAEVER